VSKTGILLVVILVSALAWVLREVVLLVFASLLLAVFLRKAAGLLRLRTGLPEGVGVVVVLSLIVGTLVAVGVWQGPRIAEEVQVLQRELPAAFDKLRARMTRSETARQVAEDLPSPKELVGEGSELLERAQSVATTTTGVLTAFGLWIFIAVLLSATPAPYIRGLLAVVPRRHEEKVELLMGKLGETLWWWTLGRLVSMAFVGVTISVGLALLGVPLAFLLGLIAALLTFVPNIGPLVSAIPAILLALAGDPIDAVWVALLYIGVQTVEGLVLDPVIDRMTVHLPPALTVTMQLVLGTLAGLAGVALAAPMTAVGIVVVSTLWVQGVLGKPGMPARR
jgi:predicted PurR-regulated permease PerM